MILNHTNAKLLTCLDCRESDCFSPESIKLCTNATKCWKATSKDTSGRQLVGRGCDKEERFKYCFSSRSQFIKDGQYSLECCDSDLCNNGSFPTLPSVEKENQLASNQDVHNYLIKISFAVIGPIFLLGIFTLIFVYVRQRHRKKKLAARSLSFDLDEAYTDDAIFRANATIGDSTVKEYMEQSITSGSGFGLPLLMQRTLAKQITLKNLIGKGKYGEVWRGIRNNSEVAVKIFFSKDEASWRRETEIYNTVLARHANILCFIGADMTSRNSSTQLWLVTDYHSSGSLYDYLITHTLTYKQMFTIIYSIVKGLNHLHEEIYGEYDKPCIAHRDIKSKNILVKTDGECVIADFGLAVTYYEKTGKMNLTNNPRVGTKRYMAPEVLDQVINVNSFESYKRADIYSLGLVFWEICLRTISNGIVEDYQPPFYDCVGGVGSDPSFDMMRKIVCIDERRPIVPNRWASDPILQYIMKLTKELWHQKASVRPSSLRIKKNLQKLNL